MKIEKHYTESEIFAIFKKKKEEQKLKILSKAMNMQGSKVHKIARSMGYVYSDMYNEPTWYKPKKK